MRRLRFLSVVCLCLHRGLGGRQLRSPGYRRAIAVGGEHDPVRPSASLVAEAAGSPRERPGNGEIVTVDKPISFHDDDDEQAASMAGVRGFGSSYLSDSGRPVGFRLPGIASLDIDEANNVLQIALEDPTVVSRGELDLLATSNGVPPGALTVVQGDRFSVELLDQSLAHYHPLG